MGGKNSKIAEGNEDEDCSQSAKESQTSVGNDEETRTKAILQDPDGYKQDWADSKIYKKAMKTEAIKRGLDF